MDLGPFDLPGEPFLRLYATLLVLTVAAGLIIPRWLQPEGCEMRVRDPDRLAWLAGGPSRFADAVVARLLSVGAISIGEKKTLGLDRRGTARSPAKRGLLVLPSPATWKNVAHVMAQAARPIEREMVAAGLAMDEGTTWQMRFWQTAPYLMLLAFGTIKWEVGTLRDRPVGNLTGLLVLTAVFALARLLAVNRRTRAGDAALAEARSRADRLRRAPTPGEVDLAVALFGTAVLAGSPWAAFHQLRSAHCGASGGSDGSGCGGGGGCGGCGG